MKDPEFYPTVEELQGPEFIPQDDATAFAEVDDRSDDLRLFDDADLDCAPEGLRAA